jgi:FkbM family methyltransferase
MEIVDNRSKVVSTALEFKEQLKSSDKVFILGTNKYGRAIADFLIGLGLTEIGFINDFSKENYFGVFKIYGSNLNFGNAKIINCVVEGRTIDSEKLIDTLQPLARSNYFAIQLAFPELPEIDFMVNTESVIRDANHYDFVFNKLEDVQSKIEYQNVVNFRLNRDISFLSNFRFRINEQYFEEFISLNNIDTFVDGGSFDGQTSLEFIRRKKDYSKVIAFEPSSQSYLAVCDKLKDYKFIDVVNKGIWNKSESLSFNSDLGSASRIENEGTLKIEVVSLDESLDEKIDFIKLDIEGAEKNAILGAKRIIIENKPVMAVCVYHHQEDYFRIPQMILEINPHYKVYFRHYTQGVFESVMYFLPLKPTQHV